MSFGGGSKLRRGQQALEMVASSRDDGKLWKWQQAWKQQALAGDDRNRETDRVQPQQPAAKEWRATAYITEAQLVG